MDFGKLLKLQPMFSALDVETIELLTRFMQKAMSTGDANTYVKGVLKDALGENDHHRKVEVVECTIEDT